MLTRYLWEQINSFCLVGKKLTLWRLWHLGRRQKMMGVLKQRGCGQRFFFFWQSLAGVNHNSKMTNGTLIQFMNYAVVMATLIKMRQSADLFVDELMIYWARRCTEFRDSSSRPHFMQCLKDAAFKMFRPSTLNQFIVMKMPKTQFFQPCNGKQRKGILKLSEFRLKLEDPLRVALSWEVNDYYEISGSDCLSNRCLKQSNPIFIRNKSYSAIVRWEVWPPDSLGFVEDTKTLLGSSEMWSPVIASFWSTLI